MIPRPPLSAGAVQARSASMVPSITFAAAVSPVGLPGAAGAWVEPFVTVETLSFRSSPSVKSAASLPSTS